ncbi:MAG: SDR family NAD(P)-dependent oxidoreductase [Pseudomonadales bacterium]|nr:SDR family NAD(P)-dependent oxidoreductase [Pseudomonadales bacterium]
MEYFNSRYGPWAIIAGASQGIGEQFSRQLAAKGMNIIMLARGLDDLQRVADDIRAKHPVSVETHSLDLASEDLKQQILSITEGKEIGLLVHNAVYSHIGEFLADDLASKQLCLDVNCRSPMTFVDTLLRPMVARKRGGVILMSSMSGNQGSAMVAQYAATKAYNTVLAEGLWEEMRHFGVDVIACVAGATKTPNFNQQTPSDKAKQAFPMEPKAVVTEALMALEKGKGPNQTMGWMNKLVCFLFGRVLTRKKAVSFISSTTRKLYQS